MYSRAKFHGNPKLQRRVATSAEKAKLMKVKAASNAQSRSVAAAVARSYANRTTSGLLGIEHKFLDLQLQPTTVAAATALTGGEYDPSSEQCLSSPAQGDGATSRDGKRIVIDSIYVKGMVQREQLEDQTNPPPPEKVYVALVLDTQSNGAQLNSEDVFLNIAANAATNVCPLRNLTNSERFRIIDTALLDLDIQAFSIEADNLMSWGGITKEFTFYHKFKDGGLPVNFLANSSGGTVGSVVDNSLHIIAFSISATATICYNSRIRFQG